MRLSMRLKLAWDWLSKSDYKGEKIPPVSLAVAGLFLYGMFLAMSVGAAMGF